MKSRAGAFTTQITQRIHLPYLAYLPGEYGASPERRWPLILFLHGAGERGNDLEGVRAIGLPPFVERQPEFPFVVIAPQCPARSDWTLELDALTALLDHAIANYRVDVSRVYLTGLSMGGRGVWQLAARHPERFAAIAPICGRRPVWMYAPEEAALLKGVPAWVFHGALDDIVPPSESELMVAAITACGGNARLTLYPEANHDSWTAAYSNPELYGWFLAHTADKF